ncbi:hypothetical protein ACFW04_009327 [Cataglyphis niger]
MMADLDYARQYLSLQINEAVCWWWYYIREISWQVMIALLAYLCVCVFLYAILKKVGHAAWQLPGPPARLLLVTAHPDDEVMFFGPLIYWLARSKASEIYLLCLSMDCKLYVLESVNIIRKYIQFLDLPISLLSASYWYLVTYEQKCIIKSAMAAHKSQYVWFRKLYMIFSRYTFINTLQEVSALDLELDLQFDED